MAKKTLFNPPDSAEREYLRVMATLTNAMAAASNRIIIPAIGGLVAEFNGQVKNDGAIESLAAIMAVFSESVRGAVETSISSLPAIAANVNRHNASEFSKIFKSNTGYDLPPTVPAAGAFKIGVSPLRSEPFIAPLTDAWLKTNTDLIKSLPTRLNPELEQIITRGMVAGKSVKTIKDEIKARYAVNDYRAKLIAQDQTLKFHSSLSRYRLESVGVTKYTWRSVQDNRVRPEHQHYNGQEYAFSDPPPDGNPGEPVRCRCRAEGIWDDGDD